MGFDARAHRTENSDLLTATNVAKLKASWEKYWEADKAICVEKTPENLLMTRFLQAAFPDSYFSCSPPPRTRHFCRSANQLNLT